MFRRVYAILVSILFFGCSVHAHGQGARVQGQILDTSGAAVAKARVHVVDQGTSTERETESNGSGQYSVPELNPGVYKVFVEALGFSAAMSDPITLNVAQNLVLDFRLHVGNATTQVVVDADTANINTTDGSVSTVIDRQFVENLPLNGRSFQTLLYLSPGVTPNVSNANTPLSRWVCREWSARGCQLLDGRRGERQLRDQSL